MSQENDSNASDERIVDLEQPFDQPEKEQDPATNKTVLLVHRRGMSVVGSPEHRGRNDVLEVDLLSRKGRFLLYRIVRDDPQTHFGYQGFRGELYNKNGELLHEFEFEDNALWETK